MRPSPLNIGHKIEICIDMRSKTYPLARAGRAVVELIDGLHIQLRVALRVYRRAPIHGQQVTQVSRAGRLKVSLLKPAPRQPTAVSCQVQSRNFMQRPAAAG